jgi:hypothetical protein
MLSISLNLKKDFDALSETICHPKIDNMDNSNIQGQFMN